jgi:nitrogen fixation NifU-like protein
MLKLSEDEILELLAHPPYTSPLAHGTHHFSKVNQSCGDKVEGELCIEDRRLVGICLRSTGCTLSKVAAMLWCKHIEGKTIDDISTLASDEIFSLVGDIIPMRRNCALLGVEAISQALHKSM